MSRTTRNWILILVLVPLAVYGAARLAVWYSVNDAVSSVRESLSPVASLEYAKTLSPVFGAFGVSGIRIRPHAVDDEITIGSALVHVDDPLEKYHFLRAAMRDTIPTSFNFSLNHIRFGLQGELASWLDRAAAGAPAASGDSSVCRAGTALDMGDLRGMGYDELVASVQVDYEYDRLRNGLVVYATMDFAQMFEITLETRIPPGEVVFNIDRMQGIPRLANLTLSYVDQSWASRFNGYCAASLELSEDQFIERKMAEQRQLFSLAGFEPSDALMNALETIARGNGELTLNFNPRDPISLTDLDVTEDPEFLLDQLGLEVLVDDKPVENLGAVRQAPEEEAERETAQRKETYKPTPLAELPRYTKNRVRVLTRDGKRHEGNLDGVEADRLILTRHLAGGSATFEVQREEIDQVLVLRP